MHNNSPPTPSARAFRSVITPLEVLTIVTPNPFITKELVCFVAAESRKFYSIACTRILYRCQVRWVCNCIVFGECILNRKRSSRSFVTYYSRVFSDESSCYIVRWLTSRCSLYRYGVYPIVPTFREVFIAYLSVSECYIAIVAVVGYTCEEYAFA